MWIPYPVQWRNYVDAWNALPFSRFLVNTLFITILIMLGNIITSALVGYGFARYRFPGRDVLFIVLLSTMMLPYVVTLIPTFLIWRNLQLINTYDPLVIGSLFGGGPFFIFLMRQFMLTLPVEMEEAARIDGANTVQIFARIVLPLVKPALLAVGIFSFQGRMERLSGATYLLERHSQIYAHVGHVFLCRRRKRGSQVALADGHVDHHCAAYPGNFLPGAAPVYRRHYTDRPERLTKNQRGF